MTQICKEETFRFTRLFTSTPVQEVINVNRTTYNGFRIRNLLYRRVNVQMSSWRYGYSPVNKYWSGPTNSCARLPKADISHSGCHYHSDGRSKLTDGRVIGALIGTTGIEALDPADGFEVAEPVPVPVPVPLPLVPVPVPEPVPLPLVPVPVPEPVSLPLVPGVFWATTAWLVADDGRTGCARAAIGVQARKIHAPSPASAGAALRTDCELNFICGSLLILVLSLLDRGSKKYFLSVIY